MDAASILFVLAAVGVNLGSQPANDAPTAAPTRHTTYFAGQAGWEPESNTSPPPAAAPTYDRYNMPTAGTTSTVGPPPSVANAASAAVTETGNSLRDGVEAGIQSANQQLAQGTQQAIDSTRTAAQQYAQQYAQQFQGWAGTTAQQAQATVSNPFSTSPTTTTTSTSSRQQTGNPFATAPPAASAPAAATARTNSGMAPPPWATSPASSDPSWSTDSSPPSTSPRTAALGTVATQTENGWTSISSTLPPPPMIAPQLVNTPVAVAPVSMASPGSAPLQPMVGNSGPGFPAPITANQPVDRSLLAQPQQPAATAQANENFDIGWGGNAGAQPVQQATIGGRYDLQPATAGRDRDLAANTQQQVTVQSPAQSGAMAAPDPWAGKDPWGDQRLNQSATAAGTAGPIMTIPAAGPAAAPPTGTGTGGLPALGTVAAPSTTTTVQGPAADQVPWMPLLVVSLSLAGSIGANLFLGWSYMDARQKYRHLVQKTANKFRRAVAA